MYLQAGEENLAKSVQHRYAGTYIAMHALLYLTRMKIARHGRHEVLSPTSVARNITAAHNAAMQYLNMMRSLNNLDHQFNTDTDVPAVPTAFHGHVTLAAIDILGAGGSLDDLAPTMDAIGAGILILERISKYWTSAKGQLKMAEERISQIRGVIRGSAGQRISAATGDERIWSIEAPVGKELALQEDIVYGVPRHMYFGALRNGRAQGKGR